jgi:general secretion pathway protein G
MEVASHGGFYAQIMQKRFEGESVLPLARDMQESSSPLADRRRGALARLRTEVGALTNRHRAFTLIELLLVVAIVCLLSTILLAVGHHAGEAGRVAKTKAELAALAAALESYRREQGDYPRTSSASELLQSLLGRRGPSGAVIEGAAFVSLAQFATEDARDPFADHAARLVDAWGSAYLYRYEPASGTWRRPGYLLYSAGPDRRTDPPPADGAWPDAASPLNADNLCSDR